MDLIRRNEPQLAPTRPRAPDEKYCFACAQVMHSTATSCPQCGAAQAGSALTQGRPGSLAPANTVFCYACGGSMHREAAQCPHCGAPQFPLAGPAKSRITASVLAFLLGGIGVHRFYLGQPGWGLLYLVFCWTFIPGIIALIEGFIFLVSSDEEFARKHSR